MTQARIALDLNVRDLPFSGKFSLRCRQDTRPALSKALGLDLPGKIGGSAGAGTRRAFCVGPDEWMILCSEAERAELAQACAALYGGTPHSLVDVSFREVGIAVCGRDSATLLSMFCARDLSRIAVGGGVRTLFDTAQALILRDGSFDYHLYVWRSFHPHVSALLGVGESELQTGL